MRGLVSDDNKATEVEVAVDALDMIQDDQEQETSPSKSTSEGPLAFGSFGFRTFGEGTSHDMTENQVENSHPQPANIRSQPRGV